MLSRHLTSHLCAHSLSLSLLSPLSGIDHFFARVATARRFDQLDADFNPGLFVLLMVGAAVATYALGFFAARRDVAEAWK